MNNLIAKVAVALVVLVGAGISANAQLSERYEASIPFDFVVAGKTFNAGEYSISHADKRSKNGLLLIRNKETNQTGVFMSVSTEKHGNDKSASLVFVGVNGSNVLGSLSTRNFDLGFAMPKGTRLDRSHSISVIARKQ